MNKEVEAIVNLGRDSIIKIAAEKLGGDIYIEDYDIKVMASKKNIYVSFDMPVMIVPQNSAFYYGAYIDLIEGISSKQMLSNPKDLDTKKIEKIKFFKHTKQSKTQIKFILEAIERSDEIESVKNIKDFGNIMTIYEYNKYYDITVLCSTQESFYKIDKKTGKIYDAGHAHLIINGDIENETVKFIEIK